ncbi:MAG TPA: glycosyltransferase family 1 protein, partial [Flavisolibacter sp.]
MFVSPDGHCSLATRVPQCMVMHDIGIIHFPGAFRKLHAAYYKWYVPKFLEKARVIATVSEFSKNDIVSRYGVKPEKLQVVFSAARPVFRPVSAEVCEKVKETWTGGREYFIYVGAIQPRKNVTRLLKAFSLFKKRQKTEMKLVLAGRMAWKNDTFIERLKTYKYRDDVVLTGYLAEDELVRLTASAYALVYPSLFEGFGVPVLEGMQCDVPVLTSGGTSMQEIGDDAALYFDPSDPAAIAEQMMRIYKDEDLRARLVARGRVVSSRFTWDRTAQLVWESMMRGI